MNTIILIKGVVLVSVVIIHATQESHPEYLVVYFTMIVIVIIVVVVVIVCSTTAAATVRGAIRRLRELSDQ